MLLLLARGASFDGTKDHRQSAKIAIAGRLIRLAVCCVVAHDVLRLMAKYAFYRRRLNFKGNVDVTFIMPCVFQHTDVWPNGLTLSHKRLTDDKINFIQTATIS